MMADNAILLIHPPVAKPGEPPAGIARLAGALRSRGIACTVIDANIQGLYHLLNHIPQPSDTWSRRAHKHKQRHLDALRSIDTYGKPDRYRRAVADINRLLTLAGKASGIRVGLANYEDQRLSPVRSADLIHAAGNPEQNPYFDYFKQHIGPAVQAIRPAVIGLSVNFLSQALCAFALAGVLKRLAPGIKIIIGGGLVSSWMQRPDWQSPFSPWVDAMVSGPGEQALIRAAGHTGELSSALPDYNELAAQPYLSPGFVLPFSTAAGCWWRRCNFCPEHAEQAPYRPLPRTTAGKQLRTLTRRTRPALIHLLDNAISPAFLKNLVRNPPGAPWYGFVRIGAPLDDPAFCRRLADAGCAMLKIGLESGDQKVLQALNKGIKLNMASKVLHNLNNAGIATYVYLLFGTPAEDEAAAEKTLAFTADHHRCIDFLNLAIFNLPFGSEDTNALELRHFYAGDLQLYSDFKHPHDWNRSAVRKFLDKRFKKHPDIQPIVRHDPPIFTSNHAAFFGRFDFTG